MRTTELETLLADYCNTHELDLKKFVNLPSVENESSYPEDAEAGDFVLNKETEHYYLYTGSEWGDIGTTKDEEIEQMQTDIDSLKLSTGLPVDLKDYVKKDDFNNLAEENVIPLTDDEIENILGGA